MTDPTAPTAPTARRPRAGRQVNMFLPPDVHAALARRASRLRQPVSSAARLIVVQTLVDDGDLPADDPS